MLVKSIKIFLILSVYERLTAFFPCSLYIWKYVNILNWSTYSQLAAYLNFIFEVVFKFWRVGDEILILATTTLTADFRHLDH